MKAPEWLKPGIYGVVIGAAALAIIGFEWGGWMTAGKAQQMASDLAQSKVVAALVPVCVAQSKQDPDVAKKIAALKAASSWTRGDLLAKDGWATFPGSPKPNGEVADACAEKLASSS